jgi:type III pantothenate kinase
MAASMRLYLDAGNTRLKYGVHDGQAWHVRAALAHAEIEQLPEHLAAAAVKPVRLVACNVAGDAMQARIEMLAARLALPLTWLRSDAAGGGVRNGYEVPAQLGADRWAALIAARALGGGAAVVVLAGTATTIDLLAADGEFQGGLILPGLTLMRQSLARHTADLPEARGAFRARPTNTDDAIVSGALHATLGAIERMRAQLGSAAQCIVSGGAAAALLPHLAPPARQVEHLVLEGLHRFAEMTGATEDGVR